VTLYTTLFLEGVKWTSASDATLIFAMTPTLTVLIANFAIPNEKINQNKILGLIAAFIGVLIIFFQSPNTSVENRLYGNLLILISALVIAIYTVYSKPVFKKINVIDFSTWIMVYGWFFLLILAAFQTPEYFNIGFITSIDSKVILSIVYLAVFIVYATIVLSYGVKRIGPSRSAIFMNLIPVFGVISSIIIIHEKFSLWYIPAFGLIMIGVYRVNKNKQITPK
jgi:drug/metabolite transporter (DMT)-like permease